MKSFAAISAFLASMGVEAFKANQYASSNGPFVGEHRNADVVEQETRSSHRTKLASIPDKYETIVNQDYMTNRKSYADQMYESVFGISQEEETLKQVAQRKSGKFSKGRLGDFHRMDINRESAADEARVYTAQIRMSDYIPFDVVVDTATDLFAIQGEACQDCTNSKYSMDETRIAEGKATIDDFEARIPYGATLMEGKWARDEVCLNSAFCFDTDFFLLSKDPGFDKYTEGIMGLARGNKKVVLNQSLSKANSRSILNNMDVSEDYPSTFSTRFSEQFGWIDFGSPSEREAPVNQSVSLNIKDDFFWSLSNTGFRIGENEDLAFNYTSDPQAVFVGKGVYSILDTAAKDMLISTLWFEPMMDKLFESVGIRYAVSNGTVVADCKAQYPSVYFDFDGYMLQVKPQDYKFDTFFNNTVNEYCQFRFRPIDAPFNVIGMPIMFNYYIQYDFSEDAESPVMIHPDSSDRKPPIEKRTQGFTKSSGLDYFTQNTPGGEEISFWVTVILAIVAYGAWGVLSYEVVITIEGQSMGIYALVMVGGLCLDAVLSLIVHFILLAILMPGNNVEDVAEPHDAIARVKATHMTMASIGAYAAYYLKTKRDAALKKKAAKVAVKEETSVVEEVEYSNNSLE